ncbi:MAG: O-antigen ligase family protein, partial [Alphaproteobacteria bacterium]|nr:O-antigen ligase family protein [Alphaproteobacteria bacterium]
GTPPSWLIAVLVAMPALGLVSALWSVIPGETAMRALKVALLLAAGMAITSAAASAERPPPRQVAAALLAGLALATVLALTDHAGLLEWREDLDPSFTPRRGLYNRGATVILLLAWLAVLALLRTGRAGLAAALFVAAGLLIVLKLGSGASMVVWVLSAAAFAAWVLARGRLPAAFGAVVAAACFAAPLIVAALPTPSTTDLHGRFLPSSWSHRLVIWQFAAERIAERPLFGWGLDASRRMPGGREVLPWRMDADPNNPEGWMSTVQRMPLHPHSLSLQVWLELGLAGAAILAALLYLLVTRAARAGGAIPAQAANVALVFAAMAVSNISYGAWQSWWLSTLWLIAAVAVLLTPSARAGASS